MSQSAATGTHGPHRVVDRVFGLGKSGTNLRTEFVAGLTTFLTMVYIVFVRLRFIRWC